jgi:ribosomal protein L12E/L44/L45/RPP1/RPP2
MATDSTAPASAAASAAPATATKPVKPDEEAFKKELAKLEKEHKEAMDRYVRAFGNYPVPTRR